MGINQGEVAYTTKEQKKAAGNVNSTYRRYHVQSKRLRRGRGTVELFIRRWWRGEETAYHDTHIHRFFFSPAFSLLICIPSRCL